MKAITSRLQTDFGKIINGSITILISQCRLALSPLSRVETKAVCTLRKTNKHFRIILDLILPLKLT